jgi:hypothetical protein
MCYAHAGEKPRVKTWKKQEGQKEKKLNCENPKTTTGLLNIEISKFLSCTSANAIELN